MLGAGALPLGCGDGAKTSGPTASASSESTSEKTPTATRTDVLVIGAGIAGLAAARSVADAKLNVVVLEARKRIGGRIWTDRSWPKAPLDLGASWIHGAKGNPIAKLAETAELQTKATDWDSLTVFDREGSELSTRRRDRVFERLEGVLRQVARMDGPDEPLSAAIGRVLEEEELSDTERQELEYAITAEIEQEYAADVEQLSRASWDEGRDDRGAHLLFPDGYDRVFEPLARGLDIRLEHPVSTVSLAGDGVVVESGGRQFMAKRAIVTVPLGVLKSGAIRFAPGLTDGAKTAIDRIGFGLLDKVFLRFPSRFWPADVEVFGRIAKERRELVSIFDLHHLHGEPVLLLFNAGRTAAKLEDLSDSDITAKAMKSLRAVFGASAPEPEAAMITRWGKDPFALGSYSSLAPGAVSEDRAALSAPQLEGRLYFAGEATSSDHPGSVHGAYESGRRQAARALEGL